MCWTASYKHSLALFSLFFPEATSLLFSRTRSFSSHPAPLFPLPKSKPQSPHQLNSIKEKPRKKHTNNPTKRTSRKILLGIQLNLPLGRRLHSSLNLLHCIRHSSVYFFSTALQMVRQARRTRPRFPSSSIILQVCNRSGDVSIEAPGDSMKSVRRGEENQSV